MALTETGRVASDRRRIIFVDEHGLGWDLPPSDLSANTFKLKGRALDRRRVLIEHTATGIASDVTPARARQLIG